MTVSENALPKVAQSPYFGSSLLRRFRASLGKTDTLELAKLYNMPESAVYNALARARERERSA